MQILSFTVSRGALIKSVSFALVGTYLLFNALNGERGIYAYLKQTHSREVIQQQLNEVRGEREQLQTKVEHLRDGSIDLDLLDEQMRKNLGVMGDAEVMVITKPAE